MINIITRCSKAGMDFEFLDKKFKQTLNSVKSQQVDFNWFISYENQEVYEYLTNQDLPPNTTLVKVPQYHIIPNLKICYEHHDAYTDYANWDWEKWSVTPYMGEEPETKRIELDPIKYEKNGFWCLTFSASNKQFAPHFPYNLYLKILEAQIQEGWIIHLDDGDVFETNDSLKKLQEEIAKHDEDTLHIFKIMNRGRGWTTPRPEWWQYYSVDHPMIHGECSGSCLCFHVKWKNYTAWDEWRFADYRTARALETVIPKRNLFDEIIIYTP